MRRRGQRGQVLSVWVAAAMPAFILAVGLGVDLSGHTVAEQAAREVAAQAARTGAQQVVLTSDGASLDRTAARRTAATQAESVGYSATVAVAGNEVTVEVRGSYTTVLLGLIGVHELTVEGSGSARAVRVVDGAES